MEYPSLEFFRQVIHPQISGYSQRTIKFSAPPAKVEQVTLHSNCEVTCRLIVKIIYPDWPGDPLGQDRELNFYQRLRPQLDVEHPQVYYAGINPGTRHRLIILEDVSDRYRFPLRTYHWNLEEVFCFLRTYARLHVQGRDILPAIGDRAWLLTYQHQRLDCEPIEEKVQNLVAQGIWQPLPKLETLIQRTQHDRAAFSGHPVTLLHNDLYPPNIGLPHNLNDPAVLVDWDMAAWGIAEIDLAYLFMQPFRSACQIDRQKALDYYWDQRFALEGRAPPHDERQALQDFADALFALAEVSVAEKVAKKPYPRGSAPRAYWDSMFGVLHQRLTELCERV